MRYTYILTILAAIIFTGTASAASPSTSALIAAINDLSARVSKLEGNIVAADLVGTYTLNQFQTELGGVTTSERVAVYTGGGTVTLATDGSLTISGNRELGHQLNLAAGNLVAIDRLQVSDIVTGWAYVGGKVEVSGLSLSFAVANGGRLLVN